MGTKNHQLHIALFPFMAQGHIIPFIDMAKLFVSRGLEATIITTPLDAPFIHKKIENSTSPVHIFTIEGPTLEVGLPENCQSLQLARRAVEVGGSSHSNLNALIEELRSHDFAHE